MAGFKSTATFDIKPAEFEKHIQALAALDPDKLKKVFTSAMRAAGTPIATEMRKLAPVGKTGELKKSITVRVYRVATQPAGQAKCMPGYGSDHQPGRAGWVADMLTWWSWEQLQAKEPAQKNPSGFSVKLMR